MNCRKNKVANAGTNPATQTGVHGPQINALIRTFSAADFSCFFVQKITCKALKLALFLTG